MPTIQCFRCKKPKHYSPSHVPEKAFCSRECYSLIRDAQLISNGAKTRFNGTENYKKTYHYGVDHHGWKGQHASYRALHYWIRRNLGAPTKCQECKKSDKRPRFIQWANIDGKYRRELNDYIPLCCSCHKIHDLNLKAKKG